MRLGEKVSARNYAAQAVADIRGRMRMFPTLDRKGAELFTGVVELAEHFALPDGGMVFNDDLRGIEGQRLRLPYPMVTVEYFVPHDKARLDAERPTYSPRRLVYLEEVSRAKVIERRADYVRHNAGVLCAMPDASRLEGDDFVFFMCAAQIGDYWMPMAGTWLFPVEGWDEGRLPQFNGGRGVRGELGVLMPDYAGDLIGRVGAETGRRHIHIDIEAELRASMEFFEAVSCSNIIAEVYEKGASAAVNARRRRDGKLPIHETKVLSIDPGWLREHQRGSPEATDGARASPRQHLRRGHIRRIHQGTERQQQIWIPPTIVGDAARGRVDKTYQMGRGQHAH